jgi:hypothetical protein
MENEGQDVNATESSAVEQQQEVNQPQPSEGAQEAQQQAVEQQEPTQSSPVASQPTVEALDEYGVPYKNRFAEYRRKYEELEQKVNQFTQQGVQNQPQYSVEQLEAFISQTDNPAYSQWAKNEVRRLEKEEQAKVVRNEIQGWKKEQEAEQRRQASFSYVAQNYPDIWVKNQQGQPIVGQWDNNNPIVREIGMIMQDPRTAKEPDALAIAADIAYARVMRRQTPMIQQQFQQQKAEVKNLQKKTLVEGGGNAPVQAKPAHRVAIDKLSQTGTMNDAVAAMKAIRQRKLESEE